MGSTRNNSLLQQVPCPWEDRDIVEVDARAHFAGSDHTPEVPHQTVSGNVGARVYPNLHHGFGGRPVQSGHGFNGVLHDVRVYFLLFGAGGYDTGAYGLGQDQMVSGLGCGVGYLLARLNHADH